MKGRRESARARVVSRYDPTAKIEKVMRGGKEQEHISVPVRGGTDAEGRHITSWIIQAPSQEQIAAQQNEPVLIDGIFWLYHHYWVEMQDPDTYRHDEIVLLVKRAVLREERELARARQEVETLERFGELPPIDRETIPDEVRMFVWQRDGGRCLRCGSRDKLEFDHIIPVADGGSSTERNVQLLCEPCNRNKGRSVS